MKIHNRILTLTIIYFVLIAYLSGFGPLSFGAGLGGLMYLFLIILWIIVLGTYFLKVACKEGLPIWVGKIIYECFELLYGSET